MKKFNTQVKALEYINNSYPTNEAVKLKAQIINNGFVTTNIETIEAPTSIEELEELY